MTSSRCSASASGLAARSAVPRVHPDQAEPGGHRCADAVPDGPGPDYFLNTHRFATGQAPYTTAVYRPVIWPATAFGAMQRLFAGPTQAELASGLRFVSSGATGFKNLTISDGVARVS